jgi:TIR domain-containing protein
MQQEFESTSQLHRSVKLPAVLTKAFIWILGLISIYLLPRPAWMSEPDQYTLLYLESFIITITVGLLFIAGQKWNVHRHLLWWCVISATWFLLSIGSFFVYRYLSSAWTCNYYNKVFVIGSVYTPQATKFMKDYPDHSCENLIGAAAGLAEDMSTMDSITEYIWTKDSIERNRLILIITYVSCIPFFAVCVISVVQALYITSRPKNVPSWNDESMQETISNAAYEVGSTTQRSDILGPEDVGLRGFARSRTDREGYYANVESRPHPVRMFYSYSHKDDTRRAALEAHLALLKREGYITTWYDRRITAGEEWKGQIDKHLEEAQIILLLISSDFLDSDYCYDIEMARALQRQKEGSARVIPIILRPVDWAHGKLADLQAIPKDGKPVSTWGDEDLAWEDAARSIRGVVLQIAR